jgi:restriction system protein
VDYLTRFDEFKAFRSRAKQPKVAGEMIETEAGTAPAQTPILDTQETPDEVLRATVKSLDKALSKELLDRILAAPPAFFEGLIITLLLSMGYGGSREDAGRAIGKSGDGGIDGVIDQDPLGLDRVYVQAKRYKVDLPVSEPEIRAFSGSLGAAKANKGVFVTTSYFTKPALEFAKKHPFKMILVDGDQLTTLMIRHNVGVRVAESLHLKKIDEDFFSEE